MSPANKPTGTTAPKPPPADAIALATAPAAPKDAKAAKPSPKPPLPKAPPKLSKQQLQDLFKKVSTSEESHLAISKSVLVALVQEALDMRTAFGVADQHAKKIDRRLADVVKVINSLRGRSR